MDLLKRINEEIQKTEFGGDPPSLYQPIDYIMALGGKRIRPVLTLMSTTLWNPNISEFLRPALAVEVFHNFSLMHDDIMDAAPLRRGQPTVHEKWDTNTAILSGDVMLVKAFEYFLDLQPETALIALKRFAKTAAEVCEGQQFDMEFAQQTDVSEEQYLEMIRLKTAVLLGFSLELGAILTGQSVQTQRQMFELGQAWGIGFQIDDDLLDVFGNPETFGKQTGGDIVENKHTILLIETKKRANPEQRQKLDFWLKSKTEPLPNKVEAVTGLMQSLEIRQYAEAKKEAYFAKGFDILNNIDGHPAAKETLKVLAQNLMNRKV